MLERDCHGSVRQRLTVFCTRWSGWKSRIRLKLTWRAARATLLRPAPRNLQLTPIAAQINTLLAISTTSSNFRPTQSPSDLYALSLSLLTTLTSHASPPPPTTYTPLLQPSSYTPFLDLLESNLGSTAGQTIRAVRKAVGYVYGGSNAKSAAGGGRDWSVRGAVNSLKRALTDFAPLPTSKKMRGGRVKGEKGWREKLASMGTNGVLAKEEVEEGMKEVLKLARDAGEKGSAEAWVLLGDLYLVSRLFRAKGG